MTWSIFRHAVFGALALTLIFVPLAGATVFTNTIVASFGSIGAGACRGAATGVAGYQNGQVVVAHPTGAIESHWGEGLQVTAVPGPAADQVGYKVCNAGASPVSSPPQQTIQLAAISADSGHSTALVARDFGSIAADSCLSAAEAVPGAQVDAAVTVQPSGTLTARYAASGGLQVSAVPGPSPDRVTLKACNVTGTAIDPPAQSFLLGSFPAAMPGAATNTSTLSYGQLGAGSCYAQTFGVPGAAPNDAVIANPIVPLGTGYSGSGRLVVTGLSAPNDAVGASSYKVCNIGTPALTPPSQNFRVMALHPPPPPCDPLFDPGECLSPTCDPVLDSACGDPCALGPMDGCGDAPVPTCGGRRATIVGTSRSDSLRGTEKRDVIVGRGGRDVLAGAGGRDLICGGGGNDKLLGAAGADRLLGGSGADKLIGGKGDDHCNGGAGKDRAVGCKRIIKVP